MKFFGAAYDEMIEIISMIIVVAIVAVIVSKSSKTSSFIQTVGGVLTKLFSTVMQPLNGGGK